MIPIQVVVCFERTGLCFSRFFPTCPCSRVGDVIEEIVGGHLVSFGVRKIVWWEPVIDGGKEINGVLSFLCYYFMQGKIFHERMEYFLKEATGKTTEKKREQGGNWCRINSISPEQVDPRHMSEVRGIAINDSDYARQEITALTCYNGQVMRFAANARFPYWLPDLPPGAILFPSESYNPCGYYPDARWKTHFLPGQKNSNVVSIEDGQLLVNNESRPDRWVDLSRVGLK